MVAWWIILGAGILLSVAINLLFRPKVPNRPDTTRDLEDPTADAGRPIPVVFGTIQVKGLNVLHFGDKAQRTHSVK